MINKVKILRWLSKGNKRWYDRDIDANMAFIHSFKEPKDLWQRSYYQFKCYRFDVPVWKRFLYSFGGIILLPFSLLWFRINHLFIHFIKKVECVGDCFDVPDMIPESLKEKYSINTDVYNSGFGLSHSDFIYLFHHVIPYLCSPSFVLHITYKIAAYSNIFYKYQPDVVVCHNEYSYSSSALTDYCRCHNVTHINIMHGERLVNIRNAFFEYDKCYVWHNHYKQLYLDLRSGTKPDDFVIETPKALAIDVQANFNQDAFADYKYYLDEMPYEELVCIVSSLKHLKDKGFKVLYRPHPRYTDIDLLQSIVSHDEIEYPSLISINTSIASCNYVIGSFSTVLLQAYLCGKGVIVDDVTYGNRIELQKKARHIIFSNGDPELLSSHIAHKVEQ